MIDDVRLALLRVQLFTAMQQLTGDDNLAGFWQLIDDVSACRPPSAVTTGQDGAA